MLASTQHQSWFFYLPLAKQAALLKDDLLEPVDQLLDDPLLVDLVRDCLAGRHPASRRTGREGIAPDRLLRCRAPDGSSRFRHAIGNLSDLRKSGLSLPAGWPQAWPPPEH